MAHSVQREWHGLRTEEHDRGWTEVNLPARWWLAGLGLQCPKRRITWIVLSGYPKQRSDVCTTATLVQKAKRGVPLRCTVTREQQAR